MRPSELAAQLRCPHDQDGQEVGERMNAHNAPVIEAAYQALRCRAGDRVLEIGPGSAGHLDRLFGLQPDLDYTGLDCSALMVRQAQRAHRHIPPPGRARFVVGDLMAAPLADGALERIVAVNVVYFWSPLDKALNRLLALLAPGGRCCLALRSRRCMTLPVFEHGFALFDGPDLAVDMRRAGFCDVTVESRRESSVNVLGENMEKEMLLVCGERPASGMTDTRHTP